MGTWCSCIECIGEQPEPTEMECWLIDKEAEYRMMGFGEIEAKEKGIIYLTSCFRCSTM